MRSTSTACVRSGILALFFAVIGGGTVGAQEDSWARLIAEADSIGPEAPEVRAARDFACGAGVQRTDSVQVRRGTAREFLFATLSLRTRGQFSHPIVPDTGAGRFALLDIRCDESGRPLTFALERDHRYFFLIFSLRDLPTLPRRDLSDGVGCMELLPLGAFHAAIRLRRLPPRARTKMLERPAKFRLSARGLGL